MSGSACRQGRKFIFFVKNDKANKNNAEKNILYQTSKPSLMVIKRPNTPVKPARKIAACNCRNAFFIQLFMIASF